MNLLWLVGGVGVILAIIILTRSWQRRSEAQDLGAVSHQWVTEHRLGHGKDSRP